jgi:membrane protein YqaA with SNARE-associated domain
MAKKSSHKKEERPAFRLPEITKESVLTATIILLILGLAYLASDFALNLPPDFIKTYGIAGVFAFFIIGTMTILIPIPVDATLVILTKIYPPELLALIAGIGASLGEMTSYALGYLGHQMVDHHELKKAKGHFEKYGYFFVFGIAFVPVIPYDIVGLAGGYLRLPFFPFLGATMAGKVLRYYFLAKTGNWFFNGRNH